MPVILVAMAMGLKQDLCVTQNNQQQVQASLAP
jgi:hypothetical protein